MDDVAAHGARDAPRRVGEPERRGKWIRPARVVVAAWAAAFYAVGAPGAEPARFPPVDRPVAPIISPAYSTEVERDRHGEAERVMNRLGVTPGMRVADIGAGDGYYTVRLAQRLGHGATIYAEDVSQPYLDRLAARLTREGVAGVTLVHGMPADPRLPEQSVDLAILAHMYHEIEHPYEFLFGCTRPWRQAAGSRSSTTTSPPASTARRRCCCAVRWAQLAIVRSTSSRWPRRTDTSPCSLGQWCCHGPRPSNRVGADEDGSRPRNGAGPPRHRRARPSQPGPGAARR